ncbi:porin [Methylobacterium gossipiicola]|uniref:Porin n=1 Tax=Methylobacterium gossipiicola TaxID=582675 RepID=A0A1I2WBL4_9HYPH|nr:porin [Methylobacterium gossipiicola]SFG98039.1 Porin subfamily protein [Methylobacterium gossipiicola]
MKLLKSSLLASAAGFAAVAGAQAADLPVKKAVPIEFVRVCSAYGAGFFYIPGTETCIRLSGRARFEMAYQPSYARSSLGNAGDTTGYRGLARINVDARTQTAYGTLRAFTRLEFASRTGAVGGLRSGTQERIGNAFAATGQDQNGRVQQFVSTEKAFIQFAGLTAGRASSFFDFYAHDFELSGATGGSDLASTNLLAYTSKLGDGGLSATVSLEDPSFRRNTIYSQESTTVGAPSRVLIGTSALGVPTFGTVDVSQRNRMPDFVGVLRYDAAWGSAQLSAAVKELNTSNINGSPIVVGVNNGFGANALGTTAGPTSDYGWAVQGGVKINMPFIAPGDTLYLQGAYGEGATLYTGYSSYNGSYASRVSTISAAPFDPYMSDATLNPFTGKLELSTSFTAVASFLHYWSPEWRSALFGSYGEMAFARGAREANALAYAGSGFAGNTSSSNFVGAPGTRSFALSPTLRDTYQFVVGSSLIWSPVKDLDIGVEGFYTKVGLQNGRVVDQYNNGLTTAAQINAGAAVRTVTSADIYQVRMRIQRDF